MKLFSILKWLFTNPPTHITSGVPLGTKCDYCGVGSNLFNAEGVFCICTDCMKKVANKVLKGDDMK